MFQILAEIAIGAFVLWLLYRWIYNLMLKTPLADKQYELERLEQDVSVVNQLKKDHKNAREKRKQVSDFTND